MLCESQALWVRQVERTIKSRFASTWQNCDKKKIIFDIVKILHFIHGILKADKSFVNETFLYLSCFRLCTFDMIIFKMILDNKTAYRYRIPKKTNQKFHERRLYTREFVI